MAIEHSEKADLGPLYVEVLLRFWFEDIQNDRNSVLVVVSNYTLVGVCSI